jgi:exonuclease III
MAVFVALLFFMNHDQFLIWNARGLNSRARRTAVKDVFVLERVSVVCLQETKVAVFSLPMMWMDAGRLVPSHSRRGFDSVVLLVSSHLRRERNSRVFANVVTSASQGVLEEGDEWVVAGFTTFTQFPVVAARP